ncbi:GNAT family N-acetyltransferase [Staphylococcus ursi]|uniref:GNAT family N-acetyltransferase n=1 Tax=Staphylococcus sp. MI 10-1553 TaxID=1912064 RepID=UPI0013976C57|nr:GNAT family N-acetyltransferase [Staphylococcus sp. MI 10-1553]QHW37053.1 GNAT family N-acetyltransferase [Staphylococcus sp. MI 10-1553]
MKKLIIGDRIELRSPDLYMAKDIFDLVNNNFLNFNLFLPWVQKVKSINDIEQMIIGYQNFFAQNKEYRFYIFEIENQELIGSITLRKINMSLLQAELGFWLDSAHVGNGYIVEAFHILSKEVNDFKSIIAYTNYNNHRCIKTLKNLHFSELTINDSDISFIKFF